MSNKLDKSHSSPLDRSFVWKVRSLLVVGTQVSFLTFVLFVIISFGSRGWFGRIFPENFLKAVIGANVCLFASQVINRKFLP